jgi:hypothetical protein
LYLQYLHVLLYFVDGVHQLLVLVHGLLQVFGGVLRLRLCISSLLGIMEDEIAEYEQVWGA